MPQDYNLDVIAIREWLAKEPHLPQDIDDFMLRKFLHSCYGSLERTKKCIEAFCTTRAAMPEVYTCRDVLAPTMQTAFSISRVTTYPADDYEVLIYQLDDPNLENFSFYNLLKTFSMQSDYWLCKCDIFPKGHIGILDMKDITIKIVPKINIMFLRDFVMFLLEGIPVRVKGLHAVNCPSYYDKLFALIKPILPKEICDLIHTHVDPVGLHKHIDPKYLPVDFGGEAESLKDQQEFWVKKLQCDRELFLNDNLWKANIKKKPKSVLNSMTGSFRTLSID